MVPQQTQACCPTAVALGSSPVRNGRGEWDGLQQPGLWHPLPWEWEASWNPWAGSRAHIALGWACHIPVSGPVVPDSHCLCGSSSSLTYTGLCSAAAANGAAGAGRIPAFSSAIYNSEIRKVNTLWKLFFLFFFFWHLQVQHAFVHSKQSCPDRPPVP